MLKTKEQGYKITMFYVALDDGRIIMEVNNGLITFKASHLPEWARPMREQFEIE